MKKPVLVIDDDEGISEVVKIILEENNYRTEIISDGEDLLERIKKIDPGLILLDIWMSGVDGRDVIKQLRASKDKENIPIIVMSALTNTEQIASEAGADGFLAKPFDISVLLETVEKYLT